jgi:hypothetical protein
VFTKIEAIADMKSKPSSVQVGLPVCPLQCVAYSCLGRSRFSQSCCGGGLGAIAIIAPSEVG